MLTLTPMFNSSRDPVDAFSTRSSLVALQERILADDHPRSAAHSTFLQAGPAPARPGGRETDSAEELAHDARNLLAAVDLYCELLAAPGVLTPPFRHYGPDLHQLARTGARLLDRLTRRLEPQSPPAARVQPACDEDSDVSLADHPIPPIHPFPPIDDLAEELLALESPLRALAGPGVRLDIECAPCAGRLSLNAEELLRILFNLVANAVEAMGRQSTSARSKFIRISAQLAGGVSFLERASESLTTNAAQTVWLSIRDNGPGITPGHLPLIFEPGFSTRAGCCGADQSSYDGRPSRNEERPAGRGLAIVRRLVESAGGTVRVISSVGFGTRFDIKLPVAIVSIPPRGTRPSDGNGTTWKQLSKNNLRILSAREESSV